MTGDPAIPFWSESVEELMAALEARGGLLVVPSAPALCSAERSQVYWQAHVTADYAILDSGYLALLLRLSGKPANRISGLRFLQSFILDPDCPYPARQKRILWVVPNDGEQGRIDALLDRHGFSKQQQVFYQAPFYQTPEDMKAPELMELMDREQPECVVLSIAGGKQEQVGYWLREHYGRRAPIICTGAAISFLSGGQANIPTWADRLYLGWFMRVLQDPKLYLPRYWQAAKMPYVLWKLQRRQPEPKN